MASQNIRINIGSSYNGSGMKQAMGAVDNLSKTAGKTSGAIGRIAGAFDGLGGTVSKSVGAISGLFGAIATGGAFGAAIAGITSLVQMFKDLSDEAEKTRKVQLKAFSENMNKDIEKYGNNLEKLAASLNKVYKAQHDVAQSTINLNNALTSKDVAQAQLDAFGRMQNVKESERGVVQAQANIDIAKTRGETSIRNADIQVSDAKANLETTQKAIGATSDELRRLQIHISTLKGLSDAYHESSRKKNYKDDTLNDKAHTTYMALIKANKKEAELTERLTSLQQQAQTQSNALSSAEANAKTARINADLENAKATAALKDAEKKQWEEEDKAHDAEMKEVWEGINAQIERDNKLREEERLEQKLRDAIAKEPVLRDELDKATEELKNAEKDLANKLRNSQVWDKGWHGGNGWQGSPNNGTTEAPISQGQIIGNGINGSNRYGARNNQSVRDAAYNARVQAGYERNARSQGYGLSSSQRREYNDLQGKLERNGFLSDRDMKRWKELRDNDPQVQREKAKREAEKAAAEREAKAKAKETAEKKLQTNVSEIVSLMKQLGLK